MFKHQASPILSAIQQIFPDRGTAFHREAHKALRKAYGEEHRHHHTLRHIEEVLAEVNKHTWDNKRAVLAAALFHDVFYEPQRYAPDSDGPGNEMVSAHICAEVMINGGVDPLTVLRAQRLILMTETHKAPKEDAEARRFLDIDMAVVGAGHHRYAEYAGRNAREFLGVFTPEQYMKGRMAFLQKTLETDKIFKSPEYAPLENQARENMMWEFAHLPQIVAAASLTHRVANYRYDYK